MQVARIRSQSDFNEHKQKNKASLQAIWLAEKQLSQAKKNKAFTLPGFSYPAGKTVNFLVDYLYADGDNINWRERMVCPVTGLNNRLRGCIHLIDFELGLRPYHDIYIAEQVTPLYVYLQKQFPNIIGSEFLGDDKQPGAINPDGLRHESATDLSFENASLDAYMSFECFEHIPDFRKSFAEAGRVLRPGGKFMWSVPFAENDYENIIRAYINEHGQLVHLMEPEYHGDPVSEKGILCFTHFGWQMLDQIRAEGFTDAYALLYRSELFGYKGNEQILFIAEKAPAFTAKNQRAALPGLQEREKINCPFCNSSDAMPGSNRADIVTCSSCRVTYLRSRPTQEAMYNIYQDYANETSHLRPPESAAAVENAGLRRPQFVEEITGISNRKGVWIDVGCGWGALLYEVRERGYQPQGFEITRNCQDFASMQLRIPVSNAQFLDSSIDADSCAVVSMVHVLEHLPYPKQTIEKVHRILEPGGLFCGIVPNIESFCSVFLKDNWVWLDPQHHYVHYSPATLNDVLSKAGFTIIKMYTSAGDYNHDALIAAICENAGGSLTPEQAALQIPQLEADGKGEEIRFFARKNDSRPA